MHTIGGRIGRSGIPRYSAVSPTFGCALSRSLALFSENNVRLHTAGVCVCVWRVRSNVFVECTFRVPQKDEFRLKIRVRNIRAGKCNVLLTAH